MTSPRLVHHLALRTQDLARLLRFYVDVLGLPVVRTLGERSVWLRAGPTLLMLERAEPGELLRAPGDMDLIAFTAASPRIDEAQAQLLRHNIPVEARTAYTLYFRDPDGRRLGVSTYDFAQPPATDA